MPPIDGAAGPMILSTPMYLPQPPVPRVWPQGRDVHLWSIDLSAAATLPRDCLDEGERERAQRFVYAEDASRYVRAHLGLRAILASYLGSDPSRLRFAAQAQGKPRLLGEGAGLEFNLSHSKDMALVALGTAGELGVDIEAVREDLPGSELAAAVLCAEELEQLAAYPEGRQATPFVACWARKEACLKALGLGLNLPPRSLHVGLQSRRQQLQVGDQLLELMPLPAPAGYCAALAAVGGLGTVHSFALEPFVPTAPVPLPPSTQRPSV